MSRKAFALQKAFALRKAFALVFILIASMSVVACQVSEPQPVVEPDAGSASEPVAGMANPAAVYCQGLDYGMENVVTDAGSDADCIFPDDSRCGSWDFLSGRCGQSFSYCAQNGGRLEEGANIGTCVFPDGSSCSEFDFFEGRCQPGEGTGSEVEEAEPTGGGTGGNEDDASSSAPPAEKIEGWEGFIVSTEPGAQYDDYFERTDLGQVILFGIEAQDPAVTQRIVDFRDSGSRVRVSGTLHGNVPDYNGSQIRVTAIEAIGEPFVEQAVVGWYGYVLSLPDGAQFDDKLVLHPEGAGEVGIEGTTETIEAEIVALRDKTEPGKYAHFWGKLVCEVPDVSACQLRVERLRVDGPGEFFEPDTVEGWEGTIIGFSYDEPGAPHPDDALVLAGDYPVQYGIDSAIAAESGERDMVDVIATLRGSGTVVRIWGEMMCGVPDAGGCHIEVYRIETSDQVYEIVPTE